jgi:hypothetical protein
LNQNKVCSASTFSTISRRPSNIELTPTPSGRKFLASVLITSFPDSERFGKSNDNGLITSVKLKRSPVTSPGMKKKIRNVSNTNITLIFAHPFHLCFTNIKYLTPISSLTLQTPSASAKSKPRKGKRENGLHSGNQDQRNDQYEMTHSEILNPPP